MWGRMFHVLGFWCFVIGLLFMAGDMNTLAILFFAQTVFFIVPGSFRLTERTYMYLFGGYMVVSFLGMIGYSFFYIA